jgi:hypothetical protein
MTLLRRISTGRATIVAAAVGTLAAGVLVAPPTPLAESAAAPVLRTAAPLPWTLVTNNPLGTPSDKRALLEYVIRLLDTQRRGDVVRVAMYQVHDDRVTDALLRAHSRGVDVRLILDRRRTQRGAHEQRLQAGLGRTASADSFAVTPYPQAMHIKLIAASGGAHVLIGSGNLANWRHWNHSLHQRSQSLHDQVADWFDATARGDGERYRRVSAGTTTLHFFPGRPDPVADAINATTAQPITVQMFTWGGTRGERMAALLTAAMERGSTVTANTGVPWSRAVRSLARAGADIVDVRAVTRGKGYPHDKLTVIGDTVYTGSDNWKHAHTRHFEVVAEVEDAALARALEGYVERTRRQAGYRPPEPPPQPAGIPPVVGLQGVPDVEAATIRWRTPVSGLITPTVVAELVVSAPDPADPTDPVGEIVAERRLPVPLDARGDVDTATPTQVALPQLEAGVTHRVEVRLRDGDGPPGAPAVGAVTPWLRTSLPPRDVHAVPISPTSASVLVRPVSTPGQAPPIAYRVAWSVDAGRTWQERPFAPGGPIRLTRLPSDARTLLRVRTVPTAGLTSPYGPITWVRPTRTPSAPTMRSVRARGARRAVATWLPPTNVGASALRRYQLEVKRITPVAGRWRAVRRPAPRGDTTRAVLRRLPAGQTIHVRVRASNREGWSRRSRWVEVQLG